RLALTPFPRWIIIGIRLFLRRSQIFGNVTKVYAHARPRRGSPAHGIDQHIVDGQKFRSLTVLSLPTFHTGQRGVLVRRIGHNDQRHSCPELSSAGWRHTWPFTFHLPKVRWPRRITEARSFVLGCEFEALLERTGFVVHSGMGSADVLEALRNGQDRKVRGFTFRNLIPVKRCGNTRVWQRSYGIR